MANYTIYVGPRAKPGEVARGLGEEAACPSEWTMLHAASFHATSVGARNAAIVAEEYGIIPSTRVAFEIDPDDVHGGRDTMFRAIARLAAVIEDDLIAITSDDRAMLWRHEGRAIVNLDVLLPRDVGLLGPPWGGGTGADLPRSIPFAEPEQ